MYLLLVIIIQSAFETINKYFKMYIKRFICLNMSSQITFYSYGFGFLHTFLVKNLVLLNYKKKKRSVAIIYKIIIFLGTFVHTASSLQHASLF